MNCGTFHLRCGALYLSLLYFLGNPVGPFIPVSGRWALQPTVTSVHTTPLVSMLFLQALALWCQLYGPEYRSVQTFRWPVFPHVCAFRTLYLHVSTNAKLGFLAAHTGMEKPLEPDNWWHVNSTTNSLILTFNWMSIPSQHTLPEHHKLYMCSFSWFSFPVLVASLLVPSSPEEKQQWQRTAI